MRTVEAARQRSSDARRFLGELWRGCEGPFSAFLALGSRRDVVWADGPDDMAEVIEAVDDRNAYFGICPRAKRLGSKRGGDSDVTALPAVWVDIDVSSGAHKADNLPTIDEAKQLLREWPLPPSAVVASGGGLHAYWFLDQPMEAEAGAALLEGWGRLCIQLIEARGWHCDNVFDLARILRVPGTLNFKDATHPRAVELLTLKPERRFSADTIDGHCPAPPEIVAPTSPEAWSTNQDLRYIGPSRPGDAFNATSTIEDVLIHAGWTHVRTDRSGQHWRHPTATNGTSGVLYADNDRFWVASSSIVGADQNREYDAFGLYAALMHGGSFPDATRALSQRGYGERSVSRSQFLADAFGPSAMSAPEVKAKAMAEPPMPLYAVQIPEVETNFPLDVLPPQLGAFAGEVAKRKGVSADMPAMFGLGLLSSLACGRLHVRINPTWRMPCQLYLAIVAPPGGSKSPTFDAMTGKDTGDIHMGRVEARMRDRMLPTIMSKRQEAEEAEARAKVAGDALLALARTGGTADPMERAQAAELRREAEELGAKVQDSPRLTYDDTTPEVLIMEVARRDGRGVVLSDEPGFFDALFGYTSGSKTGPNAGAMLKGYDGAPYIRDRAREGQSARIESLNLAICVAMQPAIFGVMAADPMAQGRGVVDRIMAVAPREVIAGGVEDYLERLMGATGWAHEAAWRELVDRFAEVTALADGPMDISLSIGGLTYLAHWFAWRDAKVIKVGPDAEESEGDSIIVTFEKKLRSSVIRLAAIFAVCAGAECVEAEHLHRAAAVGDEWTRMRLTAAKAMATATPAALLAAEMLRSMVKRSEEIDEADYVVTRRNLHRWVQFQAERTAMTGAYGGDVVRCVAEATSLLVERGWMTDREASVGSKGGRPSPSYDVRSDYSEWSVRVVGDREGRGVDVALVSALLGDGSANPVDNCPSRPNDLLERVLSTGSVGIGKFVIGVQRVDDFKSLSLSLEPQTLIGNLPIPTEPPRPETGNLTNRDISPVVADLGFDI